MYFSEAYKIEAGSEDDWFDPILEEDTQLFVDPFLVYAEDDGRWADCDDLLSSHFEKGFMLLAGHHRNPESIQYRKTVEMMVFPEPSEIGLGYVASGSKGSGTGRGFARRIVGAMVLAIEAGLSDLHRFEELGLLVENIGRDRISDISCNLLKGRLISYTQEICERHDIKLQQFKVKNSFFDQQRLRWVAEEVDLPANPSTGAPVILVPKRFLRELPTLNSSDWWDYVEPSFRDDVNWDTNRKLSKKDIIDLARRHPDLVRDWSETRGGDEPRPYDVDRDPEGLHDWQAQARKAASADPIDEPVSQLSFEEVLELVNDKFRHFVENRGGWELLWNEDTSSPKRETSIQLLYRGVVEAYCEASEVFVDREVNLGRGPVDFVFTGGRSRSLLEIKKFKNGRFWDGLEHQLISYLESERCNSGWFLAVRLSDSKTEERRHAALASRTNALRKSTGFDLHSLAVDARRPKSASNLGHGDEASAPDVDPEQFE